MSNSPAIGAADGPARKRSFTLPEGSELEGEELDEKLEEIKKKINTEPDKKIKNTVITKSEEIKESKVTTK